MLGNDREKNNETTVVARRRPARQLTGWIAVFSDGCARKNKYGNRRTVFSVRYVPRCYKQDNWWVQCSSAQLSDMQENEELVGQLVG
jgi:hypothetical protein